MIDIIKIGLLLAMAATFIVLCIGLFNLFLGGEKSDERSNKMMRLRIMFQGIALILFAILLMMR